MEYRELNFDYQLRKRNGGIPVTVASQEPVQREFGQEILVMEGANLEREPLP